MNMNALIPAAVFVPLAGWKMYSRYRSAVGRQQFKPKRLWSSVVFFPLLFVYLLSLTFEETSALAALLGGAVLGIGLASLGLRLTRFESSDNGMSYVPNPWIGTSLIVVLAARITYRFFQLASEGLPADPSQSLGSSPVTLVIIGTIAWYYAAYSAGLLYKRSQIKKNVL